MTETYEAEQSKAPQDLDPEFTIIGSGVIGLLTSQELAKQGHRVKVISTEGQPDGTLGGASRVAGAQFLPWLPEAHVDHLAGNFDWSEITEGPRAFYEELAQSPHKTGVMAIENIELFAEGSPWPKGLPEAMGARTTTLDEPIMFEKPHDGEDPSETRSEVPFNTTYTFNTFSINAPKTVTYLAREAKKAGVDFERRTLTREDLKDLRGVIINAAGPGASEFDEAEEVDYYKGHTFLLKPKPGFSAPEQALSADDLIVMPREDGTIACGALYIEKPGHGLPKGEEARELRERLSSIIERAAKLVKGLDPKLLENCEVLLHSAGLRVESSSGGIRVAQDEKNERLLHAYGFGGIGWSVGPHFAKEIAAQAIDIHNGRREGNEV